MCLCCIALLLHLAASNQHVLVVYIVSSHATSCAVVPSKGALFFTHAYHPAAQVHNTSALHHVLYCIALHNTGYCSVWFTVLHYTTLQFTHCVTKNAHRDSIDYTLSNKEILFDSLLLFPFFSIPFPYIPSLHPSHLFCSIMLSLTLLCSPVLFSSILLCPPSLSSALLDSSLLLSALPPCHVMHCSVLSRP